MTRVAHIDVPAVLTAASVEILADALSAAGETASVLVLKGTAEAFCTGLAFPPDGREDAALVDRALERFCDSLIALRTHPGPTVALVDGFAAGGGVGLLAVCDLVLAGDQARFALPEAMLGLTPATILPCVVPRVGAQATMRLMLSPEALTAEAAAKIGLVDAIIATDREVELRRWVRHLTRLEPKAVCDTRSQAHPRNFEAAVRAGARDTAARLAQISVQRRIAAFAAGEAPWLVSDEASAEEQRR